MRELARPWIRGQEVPGCTTGIKGQLLLIRSIIFACRLDSIMNLAGVIVADDKLYRALGSHKVKCSGIVFGAAPFNSP
jgi:hypothetical protein